MTVEAIRLQNFMAFKDTGWIELRPITLLFGRNSSGKSAIIRALRLLKQSLDAPPDEGPLILESRFGVDLGDFKDMMHGGSEEGLVTFHFRVSASQIFDTLASRKTPMLGNAGIRGDALHFAFGYQAFHRDSGNRDAHRVELADLQIRLVQDGQEDGPLLFQSGLLEPNDPRLLGDPWFVAGALTRRRGAASWAGLACRCTRGFLPDLVPPIHLSADYKLLSDLVAMLDQEIADFLRTIIHVSPLRPEPQRSYSFDRDSYFEWRERGWQAFLDFIQDELSENARENVARQFRQLGLGANVESIPNSEYGGRMVQRDVIITEPDSSVRVALSATGFGVSQILPIVIQSVSAPPGSLVIIEQPELHLHPAIQADLMDVFAYSIRVQYWDAIRQWLKECEQARAAEQRQPEEPSPAVAPSENPRFLIETHSEQLLLRSRLRVAESSTGRVRPDHSAYLAQSSLQAYFVDREGGTSSMDALTISSVGQLSSPRKFRGFFASDLEELAKLNSVILQTQSAEDQQ